MRAAALPAATVLGVKSVHDVQTLAGMRGPGSRAVTLLATVLISILAATIALTVVFSTVLATRVEASRTDFGRAETLVAQVQADFERQLAKNPTFYLTELFNYERPRHCLDLTAGPSTWVLPPPDQNSRVPVQWPSDCGAQWEYPQVGQPLSGWNPGAHPARAEVTPLSVGSSVRLRVLGAVGQTETGVNVVYSRTSAAAWTVYSGSDLNIEQLMSPGTPSLANKAIAAPGTSMYANGVMRLPTPESVTFSRARLAAEGGFVGSVSDDGTRLLTPPADPTSPFPSVEGQPGVSQLRSAVPTPLTAPALQASAASLDAIGCPAADDPIVLSNGNSVSYVCLEPGRSVVDASGITTMIPNDARAWLIVPSGESNDDARLNIYYSNRLAAGAASCAFTSCSTLTTDISLALAGEHIQSPVGDGGPWTYLVTSMYPSTGVVATGGPTVVGRCQGFGGSACVENPVDGTVAGLFSNSVTIWAGSVEAPQDLWIAGDVRAVEDIPVGLVASGRIILPTYAAARGVPLTVQAQVVALGAGASSTAAVTGWPAGPIEDTLKVSLEGSLAATSVARISGLTSMNVAPGGVGRSIVSAPSLPGFSQSVVPVSTVRLSSDQVCPGRNVETSAASQSVTCVGVW